MTEDEISTPSRMVFVGCGEHAFETLLPAVRSVGAINVTAVVDTDPRKARAAAEHFGIPLYLTSVEEALDTVEADALMLAGPPQMHVEAATLAMARRMPVFVEKPPAPSTDEMADLAKLSLDAGSVTMVGHNLRYTDAWQQVAGLVAEDGVASVHITYHASGPAGSRWGYPATQAFKLSHVVHTFDLLVSLLGPGAEVENSLTQLGENRDRTLLHSAWTGADGTMGSAVVSTAAPRFVWNVDVLTRSGTLIHVDSPTKVEVQGPKGPGDWGGGRRESWQTRVLGNGYHSAGYARELSEFARACRGDAVVRPNFQDELEVYRAMGDIRDEVL